MVPGEESKTIGGFSFDFGMIVTRDSNSIADAFTNWATAARFTDLLVFGECDQVYVVMLVWKPSKQSHRPKKILLNRCSSTRYNPPPTIDVFGYELSIYLEF